MVGVADQHNRQCRINSGFERYVAGVADVHGTRLRPQVVSELAVGAANFEFLLGRAF